MHSPGVEVGLAHGAAPQGLRTVHRGLLLGVGNPAGLRRGAPLPGPGRWPGAHPSPAEHPIRATCALASRWGRRERCPGKGLRSHSEDLEGRGALWATPGLLQNGSSAGVSGASAPSRPGDPHPQATRRSRHTHLAGESRQRRQLAVQIQIRAHGSKQLGPQPRTFDVAVREGAQAGARGPGAARGGGGENSARGAVSAGGGECLRKWGDPRSGGG